MEFTENKNICPITHKNITDLNDPVITPDGYTYERKEIEKWIRQNGTDPMTRQPLSISQLIINRAVKKEEQTAIPKYEKSKKDITIVWDISGSMGTEATFQNDEGNTENSGLSYHDIVGHAITVIINILPEKYRLSIVTFSSTSTLLLPLTWMDDSGKKKTLDIIKNVKIGGSTDLWGGLYKGLQHNKNGEIFLLTDGLPSYEPPRGWNNQIENYKKSNPNNSSVVKTFGFGYSLNSKLLHEIAHNFEGSFSYIPDSGFVGTAFIHALTNTLISNKMQNNSRINNFLTFIRVLLQDNNDLSKHQKIINITKINIPMVFLKNK